MRSGGCPGDATEICAPDARRGRVRRSETLGGVDYVEVRPDGVSLCVHFFGAVPEGLSRENFSIEGGARIRGIRVVSAGFHEHEDRDPCWLLRVDRRGDFSTYCLCVVGLGADQSARSYSQHSPDGRRARPPAGIDPRYACASFAFRGECAATLDCAPEPCPLPPRGPLPAIDYLARDYESFRGLLLDRLAQTLPAWRQRHAADLGVTVVEVFAYAADQLSYQLDSVATEAFLRTARRRVSVRRHARLVDYWMHEGCNARAWVTIASDSDVTLRLDELRFAALGGEQGPRSGGAIDWDELERTPGAVIFEPLPSGTESSLELIADHSEIPFYTWHSPETVLGPSADGHAMRGAQCWLPAGSTSATLLERPGRRLQLKVGDVLIFEEVRGRRTGAAADADSSHRHAVRLTGVQPGEDPLTRAQIWDIEWDREDALPFDLLLAVRTPAPQCEVKPAAVARGNVVLVDHGMTGMERETWQVGLEHGELCCLCEGANTQQQTSAQRLAIELAQHPLTHAEPLDAAARSAAARMRRDPRAAVPAVWLEEAPGGRSGEPTAEPQWVWTWRAARDLLACGAADRCFAVEVNDAGSAQLRFGDGVQGMRPQAGSRFRARVRVGSGPAGNLGRDSIVFLSRKGVSAFSGPELRPRNPLAAGGGAAPESIEHVKLYAPHAYGRILERAVAAADYAELAGRDERVQGAFAELSWTGSGYEAAVALDPVAQYELDTVGLEVQADLERARRIGHDLRLLAARRVPLRIELEICVEPGHLRGDVERAAGALLSNRRLPDGSLGYFHADALRFGAPVLASPIVAAVQALDGVSHVELTKFSRLGASAAEALRSLEDNWIAIAADEVAELEADPNFPERGQLALTLKGGR